MVKRTKKRNNPRSKIRMRRNHNGRKLSKRRNHNGRKLSKRRNHNGRKLSKKKKRMSGGAVDAEEDRYTWPYIGLKGSYREYDQVRSDVEELNEAIETAQQDVDRGDDEGVNPGLGRRPDDLQLGLGRRRGRFFPDAALLPTAEERATSGLPSQREWLEEVRLIDAASVRQAFTHALAQTPQADTFLEWNDEIAEFVRRLQNKKLFVGQHYAADDELYPNLVSVYIPTAVDGLGPYELTDREEGADNERERMEEEGFRWEAGDAVEPQELRPSQHPQRWVD
jgi:hypothetical protein